MQSVPIGPPHIMEINTYRDRCQCYRYNSFPIEWNNRVRPSHRCKRICIRRPPVYIGRDVNIHFRSQLFVWCPSVRAAAAAAAPRELIEKAERSEGMKKENVNCSA